MERIWNWPAFSAGASESDSTRWIAVQFREVAARMLRAESSERGGGWLLAFEWYY